MEKRYVLRMEGKYLGDIYAEKYEIQNDHTIFYTNGLIIGIMRGITVEEEE